MDEPRVIAWYSDGAASAVAAKLAVEKYGDRCEVVKCDTTSSEHADNERFRKDVERWVGREVVLIRSEKYRDVDDVFEQTRYMAGIAGARCTTELKKLPRRAYADADSINIFGYTVDEWRRAEEFKRNNPELICDWLLIDRFIRKPDCLRMLSGAGIRLPEMYALGFEHNNCKGCPKATSPGYWNRTRLHFPDVFARRARQSRDIGARLVRLEGQRIFLDELPEGVGLNEGDGEIECGPFCQMPLSELA
jgi:hypothetical protein